jgi:hypothetical protein
LLACVRFEGVPMLKTTTRLEQVPLETVRRIVGEQACPKTASEKDQETAKRQEKQDRLVRANAAKEDGGRP